MSLRRLSNERSPVTVLPTRMLDMPRPPRPRTISCSSGRELSDGLSSPRGSLRNLDTCQSSFPFKFTLVLVMVFMFVSGGYIKHQQMKKEIVALGAARNELAANQRRLLHDLNEALRTIEGENHVDAVVKALKNEKRDLESQLQEERAQAKNKNQIESQMKQSQSRINHLQKTVQRLSKAHAIEHFGPGPHYAEFELDMHLENGKQTTQYFTVALAPLDYMPTTVDIFLEQVHMGLWNGASFHWNAKHVIMADPERKEKFVKEGIAHVPFQEYHEKVPHVAYSLGFTGDPAGPMFYINKLDNSAIHGPNENRSNGSAEPCFGNIIIGKDTVDLMARQPSPEHHPDGFVHPPRIASIRIVDIADAHGGVEDTHDHQLKRR